MIKVHSLSKSFGSLKAVNNVSFEVKQGEIFGFLGPNGAGKSTTLNILSTLLKADTGSVNLNGIDLLKNKNECKKFIGIVPQEIALYDSLSALDNLLFWGSLYEISKSDLKKKADEVLDLVGLTDRKNDPVHQYSGGMKRRVNIASAILHKPKILYMDEPTVGVDPQSRNHIFEIIEDLNKQGMTIVYTTHYMEEVERLCDQIAIIDHGQIVANGNVEELRRISQTKDQLSIKTTPLDGENIKILERIPFISIDPKTNIINIESDNINKDISSLITTVQSAGVEILNLETQKANLEAIFLKLTGHGLRD